jgi:thiosulfate reductase/polysulfide reductase chain A
VLAHVEDGVVTKMEGDPGHPVSKGFICARGRLQHHFLYHPDRLKVPLKRDGERGGGKWKRISWEQALNEIAEKLTQVREKYGPESIATCHGTGPRRTSDSTRFLAPALGSPNVLSTDNHICYAPSVVAEVCTFGHSITQDVGQDYLSSRCIFVIGGNPVVSHGPRGVEILEAKRKNKAKLIVVDPRRIPLARQADLWLQIRPGSDLALVLGMMKIIIQEELYDKEFVSRWCYGFDKLEEHLKDYSVEKAAETTWISVDAIREAARLYATTKPAALHHRVAIEHNINSTQTDRAVAMLVALTGNIGVKGGNLLPDSIKGFISTGLLRADKRFVLDTAVEEKRIGYRQYPLISGLEAKALFVHPGLAVEAMLTGKPYPLKALYSAGGNPVVNIQNSKRVWQALKALDLHVCVDFFMTPTAELADYVLPAAFWLEREECCDMMYLNCASARQKVVEPLDECWDDIKIIIELVKRIPWANRKSLPWNDVSAFNEWRVQGMGMTFDEFKEKGHVTTPVKYRQYEEKGFNTPTGKVELYSTIFEKYGHAPLPSYVEPPESPVSTPELMKDYPFILTTGARYTAYYHSDGRQIAQLRKMVPDPVIEIHPDTAGNLKIENDDWVWVETPRVKGERVKLKAKVTPDIDPRVVHAAHAWWFPEKPAPEHGCFDCNISAVLSYDGPAEPVCGSIPVRGTLCRVYK